MAQYRLLETIYFDGHPYAAGSIIDPEQIPGISGESLVHRLWAVPHDPDAVPHNPDAVPDVAPEVPVAVAQEVAPEVVEVYSPPSVEPAPAPQPEPPKPPKRKR